MSWHYSAPNGHHVPPYETYPPFGPSTGSQARSVYKQTSPVASTSAHPYSPPSLPQNSAPPVQAASSDRPPARTNRFVLPQRPDPGPSPRYTTSFAFPADPEIIQSGAGKKKRGSGKRRNKGKEERGAKAVDEDAYPFEGTLSNDLNAYFKTILVIGLSGQVTVARHSISPLEDVQQGFRFLQPEEKEDLRCLTRELSQELLLEYASKGPVQALPEGVRIAEARRTGPTSNLEGNELETSQGTVATQSTPVEHRGSTATPFLNLREICKERCLAIAHKTLGIKRELDQARLRAEERHRRGEEKRKRAMTKIAKDSEESGETVKVRFDVLPEEIDERVFWNFQEAYLNSIVVTNTAEPTTSFRIADVSDPELSSPERYLTTKEKKALRRYSTTLYQEADEQDGNEGKMVSVGSDDLSNLEEGEILEEKVNAQKDKNSACTITASTETSAIDASLKLFVRPFLFQLQSRRLKTRKEEVRESSSKNQQESPAMKDRIEKVAGRKSEQKEQSRMSGEAKKKEDRESRGGTVTDSSPQPAVPSTDLFIDGATRPDECTQLLQVDSHPRESESQATPVPPPLRTPPFESISSIPAIYPRQLSSAIKTDKTNGGFESLSVPDSTLPSSVTLLNIDSSSALSLSVPRPTVTAVSPLPNPDSFPQDPISPVQHSPLRNSSLVPHLVPHLVPTPVPAAVERGADLDPSLDIDVVAIKQETFEASTSKEGESRMGQDETFEFEVKKESTASAEDLRAIKEEEDQKEKPPQLDQRSSSLAELASPPTDPQASLDSLELEMQVGNPTHKGDDVEAPSREDAGVSREEVSTGPNEKAPPSSDLSEVDEGAISQSGSEDSAGDSITEVLAKRKARRVSSASTVRPEKKRAKLLPDYLDELLEEEENYNLWWDDPSVSESAKAFILERKTIFGLQRSFVDSGRQQAAMQLVTSSTNAVTQQTLRSYLAVLSTYLSFCAIATVPPFPISSPMIALYLYQYRAQWPEVNRVNNPAALRFFARRISHLFDDDSEVYKQLESWPVSDLLIRELKKPIATSKGSVSTRSDAPRMSRNSSSSRISSTGPSNVSSDRKNLDKSKARSTSSQFELVVPERRDSRRAERPSMSPMVIASSISFASTKLATTIDLSNIPLPNIGDSFKSRRAVKMSTAAAIIFSQGYSVSTDPTSDSISVYCEGPGEAGNSCTFRVHASRDSNSEEWLIDETSNKHTHEPSQALKDVDWRPSTQDRDIIEAMWQVDQRGQLDESLRKLVARKRSQVSPQDEVRPSKKSRTLSPSTSERFASERPSLTYSPIPPRSSAEPSRRATSPSPFENGKPLPARSSTLPAPTSEFPTGSFPPPQLLSDDPFYYRPAGPEVITSASDMPDLSTPPASQLISFLKSLDPSLPPLAPLLQASGYSTLGSLVEVAAMEADTRQRLYREIVIRGGKVDSELFDLLERRFVEALAGDWKD